MIFLNHKKKLNEMSIKNIWFDKGFIFIETNSGHVVGNPLTWYKRLEKASIEELCKFRIGVNKDSIHWEELDEDLSLESFYDFKHELVYAKL
jgi:Protein of unknown function (DUF2442)